RDGVKADMEYIFELFPILAERRHQAGGTLSGGEQQMLAISRALMARPRMLLLDEPSLGLAPLVVKRIFEIIRQINTEQKTTIFLVEQNANLALKVAHRGYVMENGRIIMSDRAPNLLTNEDVRKAYLGI
ncbi:MAG: ATP-binding cassette domain-containing protein, partial [Desulfobacterales bacterium]